MYLWPSKSKWVQDLRYHVVPQCAKEYKESVRVFVYFNRPRSFVKPSVTTNRISFNLKKTKYKTDIVYSRYVSSMSFRYHHRDSHSLIIAKLIFKQQGLVNCEFDAIFFFFGGGGGGGGILAWQIHLQWRNNGPLFLTWINFNPGIDTDFHPLVCNEIYPSRFRNG